jgi:hypothetical protein
MNFQKINIQYSTRSNDKWNKNTGFKFASNTINRLCDTSIKCLCMSLCFQKPNKKCVLALAARIINKSQINYLASQKKVFWIFFWYNLTKRKKKPWPCLQNVCCEMENRFGNWRHIIDHISKFLDVIFVGLHSCTISWKHNNLLQFLDVFLLVVSWKDNTLPI